MEELAGPIFIVLTMFGAVLLSVIVFPESEKIKGGPMDPINEKDLLHSVLEKEGGSKQVDVAQGGEFQKCLLDELGAIAKKDGMSRVVALIEKHQD